MKHKFTVLIELEYDDENGEYEVPSISNIEHRIGSAIHSYVTHEGFDKRPNIEAAKGDAKQAFGI